jgi:hypothetical protein
MNEERAGLWASVNFKCEEAQFFFEEMRQDLTPESRPREFVPPPGSVMEGNCWQPRFYYHLDAFLTATWSIPAIIQVRFGWDNYGRHWLDGLPRDEQDRRHNFQQQFSSNASYTAYNKHALTLARHITVHREGTPPVAVEVHPWQGGRHIGVLQPKTSPAMRSDRI